MLSAGLTYVGARIWFDNNGPQFQEGKQAYVRFEKATPLSEAIKVLERDADMQYGERLLIYARLTGQDKPVQPGTYGMSFSGTTSEWVLEALRKPVRQNVRLREGWWIARNGRFLEEGQVCTPEQYTEAAKKPEKYKDGVTFKLPVDSVEGYLFPDTYDLPPLLGAEAVVLRQLQEFERKVGEAARREDLHEVVTVASMVELEAALDSERPRIAGVIYNRLKRKMRLEIDATVLYALQEWKVLGPGVVRTVKSPYNTYLNAGLPPGPIGSPSLASIRAAAKPERHGYLFYVARPDRSHYFAATYQEHRRNIRRARAERAAQESQ